MTHHRQQHKRGHQEKKREVPVREDGQEYAHVTKMLGNGRLLATCADGKERLCKIRGSMRKRDWVSVGDLVLVCLRPFQDDKADVVFKYQTSDAHKLKKLGEAMPDLRHDDDLDSAHAVQDYVQFETAPEDDGPDVDDI